ncbi:WD40-repeat-containing domain protein [Daedaleopsis nitida]|nr:WD40-repeat-containing domain protein [Daedaleopsis nitida]
MAAIITPTTLVVLEQPTLKHPPSTVDSTCPLPPLPSSLAWCAETNSIFFSSASSVILQYDVATRSLQDTCTVADGNAEPIVSLLTKDRGSTVIYGRGTQVVLASSQTGKSAQTFDTHKAPITSLSLSHDSSLLASTSAHAIHIHNLTLASHTVLRGIPAGGGSISTCAYHPHARTRLLVGLGAQLLVYDTTRPSGPVKAIAIDKDQKNVGPIVAITCSPFSKTLVAVACSGGAVGLVDLEKEKGLFRIVQMPAPLTCLSFSAEGAALYAGTENGKFLILDLRALDKPPKTVTVSENGDRVIAIAVQKKLRPGEAPTSKTATTAATKPLVQRDTNKAIPGSRRPASTTSNGAKKTSDDKVTTTRTKSASSLAGGTPRRTVARSTSNLGPSNNSPTSRVAPGARQTQTAASKSPVAARGGPQKRAFSPPKQPVNVAEKDNGEEGEGDLSSMFPVENLLALPGARAPVAAIDDAPISSAPRGYSALSRGSSRARPSADPSSRTHRSTASTTSHAPTTDSASAALPRTRSASSASVSGRASKTSTRTVSGTSASSRSASPSQPQQPQRRRVSGSSAISRLSRTPSPDFAGMEEDGGPVTPIPAYKVKGKERAALSLGTPDVDDWVKAGEAKQKTTGEDGGRKRVGFADDSDHEDDSDASDKSDSEHDGAAPPPIPSLHASARQAELAMQVSPRRTFGAPSPASASARARASWAPVPSPLRNPGAPPSPQARAAGDMLQALLRDALHDFRQETKTEIVGLHLDLIRMGGSWRREMREAMGEFAEEMRALREENQRLREENERLRRGY